MWLCCVFKVNGQEALQVFLVYKLQQEFRLQSESIWVLSSGAKQQINCGTNMTYYKCIFVLYSASSNCRSLHAVPCHCLIRALLIHSRLSEIGSGCGKLV